MKEEGAAGIEPKLVVVSRIQGRLVAQVIKTKLESHGIPVLLRSNAASLVFGLTVDGLGEVRVLVPARYAERARELLIERSEGEADSLPGHSDEA